MDEMLFRGVMDIETEGGVKYRRFVVWPLEGCRNVRDALHQAAWEYERLFDGKPQFGFMRKLPKMVEPFTEFEGMLLLDAEWMMERYVAVGGKTPLSPSTVPSPQIRTNTEFGENE